MNPWIEFLLWIVASLIYPAAFLLGFKYKKIPWSPLADHAIALLPLAVLGTGFLRAFFHFNWFLAVPLGFPLAFGIFWLCLLPWSLIQERRIRKEMDEPYHDK